MTFSAGDYVKWKGMERPWLHGRVVRRIDAATFLVEDRTGRPPRLVSAKKLQRGEPYALEQPGEAA